MEQASSGGFWLQLKTLLFTTSPEMPQMLAIVLILGILYLGDYISLKTKAFIPSVFVCAVLFLNHFSQWWPLWFIIFIIVNNTCKSVILVDIKIRIYEWISTIDFLTTSDTFLNSRGNLILALFNMFYCI